jgi:hypothetical protein
MRHYPKLHPATPTASLTLLAIAGVAVSGPLEDGEAAYQREDYATAYRLLGPLADQGNAEAPDTALSSRAGSYPYIGSRGSR